MTAAITRVECREADDSGVIFASLTAADLRTTSSIEQVVDSINNCDDFLHHRRFVRRHAGELAATMSPVLPLDPFDLSSGVTTEADQSDDEVVALGQSGCYFLSLSAHARPFQPEVGWWAGSGDLYRFPDNAGVDILIPPLGVGSSQQSTNNKFVYPRQGYFAFDPNHAQFWLHARHRGIKVDGRPLPPRSKTLLPKRARISIGPYRYIFEFKISDEQDFQNAKREYISQHRGALDPHESTSATPSMNDVQVQDWHLHGIVGVSPVSVIHAATNMRTGEVVAVKRLRFNGTKNKAAEEVDLYREMLSSVGKHRYGQYVMQMHSVLSHERPYSPASEVYLLWKPLARGDFAQLGLLGRWSSESEVVKKPLFITALFGLMACHESGWIHRDIKPANLGVTDLRDKPRAMIMDLGQAIRRDSRGHQPRIGHCGTIGFLAPELENNSFAATYNEKVDVWSMGAVGYFLFFGGRIPWSRQYNMFVPSRNAQEPTLQTFRDCRTALLTRPRNSLSNLIGQMLSERPCDRPGISLVLQHPALRTERETIEQNLNELKSAGQKRNRG